MKKTEKIRAVITNKSHVDLLLIYESIAEKYNEDISNKQPVFLSIDDFHKKYDDTFNPYDIIASWWQINKLPILFVNDLNDLDKLHEGQRSIFESICAIDA